MHLQKIGLLCVPLFAFGVSISVPVNLPALLTPQKALAQAPNDPKLDQNLQKNPDKAQALRQAMLTTLKQHPNPKNWAAFTRIGESY